MTVKVMFFPNGVTACFQDGKQVAELQEPWFLLYVGLLAAFGIDPCEVEFTMPDARGMKVFQTEDGKYNWEYCP